MQASLEAGIEIVFTATNSSHCHSICINQLSMQLRERKRAYE